MSEISFHKSENSRSFPTKSIGNFRLASDFEQSDNSDMSDQDVLRERIRAALDEADVEPVPVAVELGRGRDFLTDFLKGRKKKLDADFVADLAIRLGFASADHLKRGARDDGTKAGAASLDALRSANIVRLGSSQAPDRMSAPVAPIIRDVNRRIPVVGDVEAGVWRETVAREAHDIEDYLAMDVQGYEQADLKAMRVAGPSMNKVYLPGRYVVLAHPAEAGLRNGDFVVVERRRGSATEITLKEFVQEAGGRVALWPRSTHPDFQEPFYLKATEEGDQDGVAIIGVVVADFGRRDRPPIAYPAPR